MGKKQERLQNILMANSKKSTCQARSIATDDIRDGIKKCLFKTHHPTKLINVVFVYVCL
jgi:hypothetical protein